MAKAKKNETAASGATKKQATETKKAPTTSKPTSAARNTTRAAASTTKASATSSRSTTQSQESPAVGGAATKRQAPAKSASSGPASSSSIPLIDTSLAAEAAAKFVVNRALLGNSASAPAPQEPEEESHDPEKREEKRESSTFKQLKAGLNKPPSQGLGNLLGNSNQGKKGNTPFGGGNQQVGRNQTFGADVNRSGVPRRTGG